jgi:hypothetical protein
MLMRETYVQFIRPCVMVSDECTTISRICSPFPMVFQPICDEGCACIRPA